MREGEGDGVKDGVDVREGEKEGVGEEDGVGVLEKVGVDEGTVDGDIVGVRVGVPPVQLIVIETWLPTVYVTPCGCT